MYAGQTYNLVGLSGKLIGDRFEGLAQYNLGLAVVSRRIEGGDAIAGEGGSLQSSHVRDHGNIP